MQNILLILSSKLVDDSLRRFFGDIPSALIPIEGKVALDHLYEATQSVYDKIYITVYQNKELIIEHLSNKKYNVEVIEMDIIKDIGYSIQSFFGNEMNDVELSNVNFTVLFADTYLKDMDFNKILNRDVAIYAETNESIRWTTFELSQKGELIIHDKKDDRLDKNLHNSFIGLFNFVNPLLLYKFLLNNKSVENIDSFYESLFQYNKINTINLLKIEKWNDLGHLDNYLKVKTNVKTRYFNSIDINLKKGILIKRSEEKYKLKKEIEWYLTIPKKLEFVVPRIFDYSLTYHNIFIEMEYYGYPTLHEMYVYGNYSVDYWKNVFNVLFDINREFMTYVFVIDELEKRNALEKIYLTKTVERLNVLKKDDLFNKYFTNKFYINNKMYKPLNFILENLEYWISKFKLYDLPNFNIIHGDYFFANILYEPTTRIVRLIDPRGDFGGFGIYGDNRYELAKLSHSVEGKYDFIVEDLFFIDDNENSITYKINSNSQHEKIQKIFYEILSDKADIMQIRFIESLLFLSMIPLHRDSVQRQKIMMCVGVEIMNDVLKGELEC